MRRDGRHTYSVTLHIVTILSEHIVEDRLRKVLSRHFFKFRVDKIKAVSK